MRFGGTDGRMTLDPSRRVVIGVATALLVSAPAPAAAQRDEPTITRAPALTGSALVGSPLEAVGATWAGRPPLGVNWRWLRCDTRESLRTCAPIDDAFSPAYTVAPDDLAKHLRAVLWISSRYGYAYAVTPPTVAVTSPPPPPPPVVTPAVPLPSPPVVDVPVVKPPKVMRPAPLVRVSGWLTLRGARLTLLTVRAPRGARISVRCSGFGCPRVAPSQAAKLTRLRRYEGMYRAGARIVIRVTRAGFIGKHTVIRVRRGKAPLRRDRCLVPGTDGPTACAAR